MKYSLWLVCLFVLSSFAIASDADSGKFKAETCLGCHGVPTYGNVYPSYHVPKLVGQHAEYIVAALKAYQSGERSHPTMRAQASGLSEADMQDIAAFFSGQPVIVPSAQMPPLNEELKAKLAVCAGCHSMDGNSPLPQNPRIAGQYRDYLYQSLLDYKDGKRKNPIMLGIITTLNDADMQMLSRYFSKQKGLDTYDIEHQLPSSAR